MIDLTNQRFGALVALQPVQASQTSDHRAGWLVRCDCGTEKVVNGSNLRRGKITSCGCGMIRGKRISKALIEKNIHQDVTGQTWGELTAVKYVSTDKWLFRCSCGTEKVIRLSLVKAGDITSCGHVLAETGKKKMLVDNTVGHYDGTIVTRLKHIMENPVTRGIRMRKHADGSVYYQVRLELRHKTIYLGHYDTFEEAETVRRTAEQEYYLPIIREFNEKSLSGPSL